MSEQWVPKKPNFGKPPPGYVAGIGRGATGFVTRSDLGPAVKSGNHVEVKQSEIDDAAYADNKFDSWEGYRGPLFVKQQVDEEDRQADAAFDLCEKRMQERRQEQIEKRIQQELRKQKKQKKHAPISEHYTDLKRELAKITEQEWMNIPESADSSIKKRKKQKYTPVPDSLLVHYLTSNPNTEAAVDSNQDFRDAKSMLLKSNLEKEENKIVGKSNFDKIGYLTTLNTSKVDQEMLGDIKRARLLHKSALSSNPNNPDIWLSAARIEEIDGKIQDSRAMLRKALEYCSNNEDIWIELSRVERADESKNVLIQALRQLPKSEKIWLTVARKEDRNKQMKSKILRKGLENLPQSTRLWKQLIQLQDIDEAKQYLYKAVQCLPHQVDLWLGLAKLETYENAKNVLNQARKANPLSLAIWINAAKLEETQSADREKTVNKIELIITKGREILKKNGNTISRQQFLQQALMCQRSGNIVTCQSIIKSVITLGLTEEELNLSIFKDVELYEKQYESVYTVRYLYKYGVQLTRNPRLFQKMLEFEQRLAALDLKDSTRVKQSQLEQSMKFGLKIFPNSNQFWLVLIDRLIDNKNYEQAQAVIKTAIENVGQQQKIKLYLKQVTILKLKGEVDQARSLLKQLESKFSSSEIMIETVRLEYQVGNYQQAWNACSNIFQQNIKTEEVWELAIRIKKEIGSYQECKMLAERAVHQFPKCLKLWELEAQLQISFKYTNRARAVLDKALMKNPKNQNLHLLLIELEIKAGGKKQINSTLAKALKECPKSGEIWGISILLEPHNTRKKKASIAIEQCGNNPYISCAVAKLFWKDNKIEKARKWLEDALLLDKTNGDIWSYYYKLIAENYPTEVQKVLQEFKIVNKITHGRKWMAIKEESKEGWRLTQEQILKRLVIQIGDQIHEID